MATKKTTKIKNDSKTKKNNSKSNPKLNNSLNPESSSKIQNEVIGIIVSAVGIILFLGIYTENIVGMFGDVLKTFLVGLLGIGGYIIPLIIIFTGILLILRKLDEISSFKQLCFGFLFLSVITFIQVLWTTPNALPAYISFSHYTTTAYENGAVYNGGLLGCVFGNFLIQIFGKTGSMIILAIAILTLSIYTTRKSFVEYMFTTSHNLSDLMAYGKNIVVKNAETHKAKRDIRKEEQLRIRREEELLRIQEEEFLRIQNEEEELLRIRSEEEQLETENILEEAPQNSAPIYNPPIKINNAYVQEEPPVIHSPPQIEYEFQENIIKDLSTNKQKEKTNMNFFKNLFKNKNQADNEYNQIYTPPNLDESSSTNSRYTTLDIPNFSPDDYKIPHSRTYKLDTNKDFNHVVDQNPDKPTREISLLTESPVDLSDKSDSNPDNKILIPRTKASKSSRESHLEPQSVLYDISDRNNKSAFSLEEQPLNQEISVPDLSPNPIPISNVVNMFAKEENPSEALNQYNKETRTILFNEAKLEAAKPPTVFIFDEEEEAEEPEAMVEPYKYTGVQNDDFYKDRNEEKAEPLEFVNPNPIIIKDYKDEAENINFIADDKPESRSFIADDEPATEISEIERLRQEVEIAQEKYEAEMQRIKLEVDDKRRQYEDKMQIIQEKIEKPRELEEFQTQRHFPPVEMPKTFEPIEIQRPYEPKEEPEPLEPYIYDFPSTHLLKEPPFTTGYGSRSEILENSEKLETTLKSFGVEAKVIEVSVGPSVTRYELSPGKGVKVSKISGLSDDLALNLAAHGIRIEAPIPGKAAVGIEVPNNEVTPVFLKEVIDTDTFRDYESKLAFAVGKDIAGNPVVADIAKMPHMLIAGATGSGKSVCINTLITSIIYKADPSEVKLLMVDPKVVELRVYNGIPHLLIPVVTDPKKAAGALNWAVKEMNDRYNMFAESGSRDLKGYNEYRVMNGEEKLPQIVIIIDELADLMMTAAKEVEDSICRLAQMARAAGLHLIIATQRPSVDVITGLIKANIPSRLAFAVSSGTDSRTVLDMTGAEKLLGKGDMLFYPSGLSKPLRVQGAFVSDKEVEKIVESVKIDSNVTYDTNMINAITSTTKGGGIASEDGDEEDDVMHDAIAFLVKKGKASASSLQRQFRIGYNRASRLIEDLENRGIVGPEDGSKPRQVLMTQFEWEDYCERRNNPLN